MTTHETAIPSSLAAATEFPVGLAFDISFEAFSVRLTALPNGELRFHIPDGPFARTETVKITTTLIRPGVFLVSWIEAGGATVVHVEDFANAILYSHATLPDGTFLRMQAPIRLASAEKSL